MGSHTVRAYSPVVGLAAMVLVALCPLSSFADGGMDPAYVELLAEPNRAVGRTVDWRVRLRDVQKRFYTYHMEGHYLADPGTSACKRCPVAMLFRGRPDENAKPSRFAAGQTVTLRGVVIRLVGGRPLILVSAIRVLANSRF